MYEDLPTFKELTASFEALSEEYQAIDFERFAVRERLLGLSTEEAFFEGIIAEMKKSGVSRQMVLALESQCPGSVSALVPVNSFTLHASRTNLTYSIEAAEGGKIAAIVAVGAAVLAAVIKLLKWAINHYRNSKRLKEMAAKSAAEAYTASKAGAKVVSGLNVDVISNDIAAMRAERINKAYEGLSPLFIQIMFEPRIEVARFLMGCKGLLENHNGASNLFNRTKQSMAITKRLIEEAMADAQRGEYVLDLSKLKGLQQPLLPLINLVDELKVFPVRRTPGMSSIAPSMMDSYRHVDLETYQQILVAVNDYIKVNLDNTQQPDVIKKILVDNGMLNPASYGKEDFVEKLDKQIAGVFAHSYDESGKALSTSFGEVDSVFNDLKATLEKLQPMLKDKRSPNLIVAYRNFAEQIALYNLDVATLTRVCNAYDRITYDLSAFSREIVSIESEALSKIQAILDDEQLGKAAKIVGDVKAQHRDVASRFKKYV